MATLCNLALMYSNLILTNTHSINYLCLTAHHQFFSPHSDHLVLADQLYWAIYLGKDSVVPGLLARGAPTDSDWYYRERSGWTPLMMACVYNRPLTAGHLLKWGASMDARDKYNETALHLACTNNNTDCVRLLLAHNSPTGEPGCVCSCVH